MLTSREIRHALAVGVVFLFAGCGTVAAVAPGLPDASKTKAASGDLIYATSADGKAIEIFSYPTGTYVRKFAPPAGTIALESLCSDKSGDVFVTGLLKPTGSGYPQGRVYEFAHGGTKVVKTLELGSSRPFGCSVDPTSGTLAVASVGFRYGEGSLETFAPGGYTLYYSSDITEFYYCAYDNAGNLFVNGTGAGTQMHLDELGKGLKQLAQITLDQYVSVSGMGQLQWDGRRITLEDLTADAIYRLSISGPNAKVAGKTRLNGWDGFGLSSIASGSVIVPTGISGTGIGFWKYPAGGAMVRAVSSSEALYGLTVSRSETK